MSDLVVDPFDEAQACSIQKLNPTNSEAQPISTQAKTPPPLFNRAKAQVTRKREKPIHRAMVELAAKGWTPKEISEEFGVNIMTVHQNLNQPHSAVVLAEQIHDNYGTDREVVELIKESVIKAVETTIEIMEDDTARKSDRLAAANLLLERRYGKANQPINRGTEVDLNNLPDSELAKMLPNN